MKTERKAIIARLVESGAITFDEALVLMEPEKVIEEKVVREIIYKEKEVSIKPKEWPPFVPFKPYWMKGDLKALFMKEAKRRFDEIHKPDPYIIETISN